MGDNLEVALFEQRFEAGIVGRFEGPDLETVTVVGRHCESGDILVDGVDLSAPEVGDLLAVPATGADCFTMSNRLQRQPPDPGGVARDGRSRLVVRRETWADLSTRDVDEGSSRTSAGVCLRRVSPRKYAGSMARWISMNTMPRTIRPRPRISTSPTPPISAPLP